MILILKHSLSSLAACFLPGVLVVITYAQIAVAGPTALSETYSDWSETYSDWVVRCSTQTTNAKVKPEARLCEMTQEWRHQETDQRVLMISLRSREDAGATLTLIAPFGLLLSDGVRIGVDGKSLQRADFNTCLPSGCVAITDLIESEVDTLSLGVGATVLMSDTSNQGLLVKISLSGFTAAWNRLGEVVK